MIKLKKLLFVLLLPLCFSAQVFAWEDVTDQFLPTPQIVLNESKNESNKPLENLEKPKESSKNQKTPSKSAREYLENAKQELTMLKEALKESESGLTYTKILLSACQENLNNAEKALKSNNEDEENLEEVMGEIQTELDSVKKQLKSNFWFSTIGITITSLVPTTIGAIEYFNGNCERGKDYMWTGLGIFVGAQVIYQGGHWIFKVW